MTESLSKKTLKSSVWSIIDILFRQGVGFIVTVILARLLTPADYGTIGVMMIFITIFNVFVDSGFTTGLIRKQDCTEADLSTAFFFNVFVGIVAYFVIFIGSPVIASFFNNPLLTTYMRVLGLVLIFNSLNMVQNAILISSMRIRQLTIVTATSQITTGVIAIAFAYRGYGVWSLIMQQLSASILQAVLLLLVTKWKPNKLFKKTSFNYLWSYGSRLLSASLIETLFNQAYSFVIGKVLGKNDLGLYSRANQFAVQPSNVVTNIIYKSLMPALSASQYDFEHLRSNYIKCVNVIGWFSFPVMFMLAVMAKPLIQVMLGPKWIGAIPLFQILCIGYAFDVFSCLSLTLTQVMARTDITLKMQFIKKPLSVLVIIISICFGLNGIVIGQSICLLIGLIVNMFAVRKLLDYNYYSQLLDILKYATLTLFLLLPIFFITRCFVSCVELSTNLVNIMQVLITSSIFMLTYLKVSKLLRLNVLADIRLLKK